MTKITNFRNPVVLRDGRIDCEVEHPVHGWIPTTLDPVDVEANNRELHAKIKALPADQKTFQGPKTSAELLADLREQRDHLLKTEIDPYATNIFVWNSLTQEDKDKLTAYRQSLLDLPQKTVDPAKPVIPTPPVLTKRKPV